jgi:bifunctional DNase/RNase
MAKKKNSKKGKKAIIIASSIILASLIVGFMVGIIVNLKISPLETTEQGELPTDFLSTTGFEKVSNIDLDLPTLILSTDCYNLKMNITEDQIYSIGYALNNISSPRPLTHDLIKELTDNYNIEILQIKIDSYTEDKIYKAKIIFRQGNKVLVLDARPSDATGISVRTEKPKWIGKDILEQFGTKTC